jgi:hypothetical protein
VLDFSQGVFVSRSGIDGQALRPTSWPVLSTRGRQRRQLSCFWRHSAAVFDLQIVGDQGHSVATDSSSRRQFGVHSENPVVDAKRTATKGHMGAERKELIMSVLFRFNGQAAYEIDTRRRKKIRVVFGMIDEARIAMAWYLFSSNVAKSKRELAHPDPNPDPMPPEEFGYRGVGGRDIPHTFKKVIGLDELALHSHGTPATLTLETDGSKRFISCRIDQLTTKAKEVVTFPFGLQTDTDPLASR